MKNGSLEIVMEPELYFHEEVQSALDSLKVDACPETRVYIVNLLKQFILTENLFTPDENGNLKDEPLALMIKEANEEEHPSVRNRMFQKVGDFSLYISGYFQESLGRRLVERDYYVDLGGKAYSQVALRTEIEATRKVFLELAEKFSAFVDVLGEIGEKALLTDQEQDIVRLYDIWLKTKSGRAAKALRRAGIYPDPTNSKKKQ